ncbi:MAG: hybrid sensor histidine kinase/response regulator [Burkholderiales bacterium PBB4]|nr:MAG: hybrid sensor histidine kinase/response regulator [Burkholderiales bacterium PBB4]
MALLSDPGRLRQILVNVVGNAIKFTSKGEIVVRVAAQRPSSSVCLVHVSVQDTGIGIPADKLATIFEPFSQEDSSTTRKFGGTGLGLTICARLVEAMGGKTWVESELGRGSTFHFTIRADVDPQGAGTPEAVVKFDGRVALIIDDNEVNRLVLMRTLQFAGMRTQVFGSGSEALAWLEGRTPLSGPACDVVLLDAQMPELNGFEVATRIHGLQGLSALPLVMLSSAGMKGDAQRARDAGIVAYLSKPIGREDLMQVLGQVLNLQDTAPQALITKHSVLEDRVSMEILLVEDNVVNQKLAVTLLERWGHVVTVAENGKVALERCTTDRFDVILMDMMMPVMDGLEATRRIREAETGHRTPIVAMTANAMESDRDRCLAAGMDDYLSKPIKAVELQELLKRYVTTSVVGRLNRDSTFPAALESTAIDRPFDYRAAIAEADQEILDIIAVPFCEQWPEERQRLLDGLEGDLVLVERTAHSLKGTLSMFGAEPATALALRLERCAQASDTIGVRELVQPLIIEVERMIQAIP